MSNENDLLSTAKALNSRVKQQEQERAEAEREARDTEFRRYWLVMSSMVRVRKAMREMHALDLGERFFFAVEHEEADGWPILSLQLQDSDTPDAIFPRVRVVASIKDQQGIVEIFGYELSDVQNIDILHELDVAKVASTLKKFVKHYLDFAGDVIEDILSNGASPYAHGPKAPATTSKVSKPEFDSLNEDLFVEDHGSEFMETVSPEEEVEAIALPSFDS